MQKETRSEMWVVRVKPTTKGRLQAAFRKLDTLSRYYDIDKDDLLLSLMEAAIKVFEQQRKQHSIYEVINGVEKAIR